MPHTALWADVSVNDASILGALERGLLQMQLLVEINGVMTPAVLRTHITRGEISLDKPRD
jgi:hypothetical protein